MKEITLTKRRRSPEVADLKGVVRITPEAELTLWRLEDETGLSLRSIASSLIVQAAAVVRILDETDSTEPTVKL